MTTTTFCEFSALAESDSVFWYVQGAIRGARRTMVRIILLPPLLLAALVLAQLFPFRVGRGLAALNQALPDVSDSETLTLVRDMLRLARASSSLYRKLCLFHGRMADTLVELDETLDSLDLVLANTDELKAFVASAEQRRNPNLPLQLTA